MSIIEHSVDVAVPVRTAYDQWTQFESFPEFMEGVESVEQLDDTHLTWSVRVAGVHREFEAEITEQSPDERVSWRSLEDPHQSGVVTFHRVTDDTTRVMLQMEFDPEGVVEQVGDKLGLVRTRVHGDLERFKRFIESKGQETGGWRGAVPAPPGGEHGAAARSAPDAEVLYGTGTTTPGFAPKVPTGTEYGEPMPPRPVGREYPPEAPLPAPGGGPVSPQDTPRRHEEPPPRRLA